MERHYAYFQNKECEFFPCHKEADPGDFNCLFCYCPLYTLGKECGGNFTILENGVKDCSHCLFPHKKDHYDAVIERLRQVYARKQ